MLPSLSKVAEGHYLEVVWGWGVGLVIPRIGGLVASDQSLLEGGLAGGAGECAGRGGVSRALPWALCGGLVALYWGALLCSESSFSWLAML